MVSVDIEIIYLKSYMPNYSFTSVWLDSGIPGGMTDFLALGESFCCSVSRLKLVAIKINHRLEQPFFRIKT